MQEIPFHKLTSFGNNFVVIDEIDRQWLTEAEKQRFADEATNINFGIGCDNLLVVQRCSAQVLEEINAAHRYWKQIPDPNDAELIFRMFEPDGSEAYSCGNGLMCIARYLSSRYGITQTRILTKVPMPVPGSVTIGTASEGPDCFANLGNPERMFDHLVDRTVLRSLDESIDLIENLEIRQYRATDAIRFFNSSAAFCLRGYLVFTGEPHLVILSDNGFSLRDPIEHIFPTSFEESRTGRFSNKRMSTGAALVNFIGYYFVKNYRHVFPKGININFVRKFPGEEIIEYRCFERGINKETLACGTGALACAFVMRSLEMATSDDIRLWPYLCRTQRHDAEIRVKKVRAGWQISGQPTLLFDGRFAMQADSFKKIHLEDQGDLGDCPQPGPADAFPPGDPDLPMPPHRPEEASAPAGDPEAARNVR
ncbi:hypothetical protein [Desulfococcus sp.]|uniref:hypothetical protein n=1 Tax=Desulfococcus sp. TaxID=2025834 RepID=UPI003592F384